MKVITYRGKEYACPFSEAIPRHTADERARMDENTEFVYPVLLYLDTDTGRNRCVLDGEGRLESAARTGAAVEFRHLGPMPTAAARELAERIENDRRHEKPEVIRRRREERLKRVAEARAEGKSIRTIAEEEGVSPTQVVADLKAASEGTVQGCTVETPSTVTGKDGKQRPATMPKAEPQPEPAASGEPEFEDDPDGIFAQLAGEDGDEDLPGPEDAPETAESAKPVPGRRKKPKHFTGSADTGHPHEQLLNRIRALAAQLTVAINAEGGERLWENLQAAGLVRSRDLIVNGQHFGHVFTGLRGLRWLVRISKGKHRPAEWVRAGYEKAQKGETP